tara:strand:+ start:306 stop:1130 length:825 start_codon:yes stop_codon:yes gene_type:complete
MKVVLFTSTSLRHQALSKRLSQSSKFFLEKVFHESVKKDGVDKHTKITEKQLKHFQERSQSEKDVFRWFLKSSSDFVNKSEYVDYGWFSSENCLERVKKISPDLILVYGTSIIKGEIINLFRNRIINLHLGLSPYYRGAGTNYFPFVNGEPEYCGATFLYLDEGIDTGKVIHQIRPEIMNHDSFHQLSNRFLLKTFDTFKYILENFEYIKPKEQICLKKLNKFEKYYKKKDFTQVNLQKLHENFNQGIILNYLSNKSERDNQVPIVFQNLNGLK